MRSLHDLYRGITPVGLAAVRFWYFYRSGASLARVAYAGQ